MRIRTAPGRSLGLVACALGLGAWPAPSAAKPDACTINSSTSTATCQGNQSAGISDGTNYPKDGSDFPSTIKTLIVNNVPNGISPVSGTSGIVHFGQSSASGDAIAVQFTGPATPIVGILTISTTSASAHGILAGGQGKTGAALGSLAVTANGDIETKGTGSFVAHGIFANSIGGRGSSGGDNEVGSGGSGGAGGGDTAITVSGSGIIQANGDGSSGVLLSGTGGSGGGGGTGDLGDGGHGGDGGALPVVNVFNTGSWSISSNGDNAHAFHIVANGGNGGNGGTGLDSGGRGGAGGSAVGFLPLANGDAGGWSFRSTGSSSHGLFYQSQAGAGGRGGQSDTSSGGTGGVGGNGGNALFVFNRNDVTATTVGDGSVGIYLSSTGGNGGSGGSSDCCNGGTAGAGGNGGAVGISNPTLNGSVQTSGKQALGLLVASTGGTGGNGGSAGVGGGGKNGGAGGLGGSVTITSNWTVTTSGDLSAAIAGVSLGGPGGKGSDGGFFNPSDSGSGGNAGAGGGVTLTIGGSLRTTGGEAHGLIAQSIGGHGGNGGSASSAGLVTFGASGGSAGPGGTVTVTNSAAITTTADQSVGIVAQSIGGGGGHGGGGFGAFYAQGGSGSIGGAGGSVTVTNTGTITLSGNDAHGIQAQSIGGTGGDGGSTGGIVALGGGGANTSPGGAVKVVSSGTIATGSGTPSRTGPDPTCGQGCSHGIFAQSIGGGGGNGGSSAGWFAVGAKGGGGGDGGTVEIDNTGDVSTRLINSHALFAQSIGGGGGSGGNGASVGVAGQIAIGGAGAKGGNAVGVTVNSTDGAQLSTQADNSHGIFAQSIGGGGGHGGFAVGVSLGEDGSAGAAIGGTGGPGGGGGAVTVSTVDPSYAGAQRSSIVTAGSQAYGILAQSIGGGGGNGGFAIDVAASASGASLAFAMGGSGGIGGNGAGVSVTTDGTIATTGYGAHALIAQSIGGGGGNGGFALSGAANLDGSSVAIALGGKGNAGGTASTVGVQSSTSVSTSGDQAHGILAQSLGGGGGNGGLSLAATAAQGGNIDASVAVGGNGGKGGAGLGVTVMNSGRIVTTGDGSRAIMAQSIGGGGGSGGMAVAADYWSAQTKLRVALGGNGGGGGNGGTVTVTNQGALTTGTAPSSSDTTTDSRAHAIFAQSVGGGGGSGGIATLKISTPVGQVPPRPGGGLGADSDNVSLNIGAGLGGAGGAAGAGGQVQVTNTGNLVTVTDSSSAIFAQSIGGGGGDGGVNASSAKLFTPPPGAGVGDGTSFSAGIVIGGAGGSGNIGGPVQVSNTGGSIQTGADGSYGIFAQSVGGGGGDGGTNTLGAQSLTAVLGDSTSINMSLAMGGSGGSGHAGGTVGVTNDVGIKTAGVGSHGIFAQSVGGGGGSGGAVKTPSPSGGSGPVNLTLGLGGNGGTGGNGNSVNVASYGGIGTSGDGALGILAQSVGGGGGDAGTSQAGTAATDTVFNSIVVEVGGTGGASGAGGAVTVDHENAPITTRGSDAAAVFAQSVGGGGGRGGTATAGMTGTVAVGGGGGAAGNGGTVKVTVKNNPAITTGAPSASASASDPADASYGIFAQSVGGGGGAGGSANLGSLSAGTGPSWGNFGVGLPIALPGGSSGDGGAVTVSAAATITTFGASAVGILAQSVGGGGGVAGTIGTSPAVGYVGSGGGSGSGGNVEVDLTGGSVTTSGASAHGILAQSVGGATASGSAGKGGAVTVTVGGDVRASGADANGVMVQSKGLGGNGVISVTIDAGATVQGGSGIGTGLLVLDGAGNQIVNNGTILGAQDVRGRAIETTAGDDRIINHGLVAGSIRLGTGTNRFENGQDGTLLAGRTVDVGLDGVLVNAGSLAPGGLGRIATTEVSGRLEQTATGRLLVDLDARRARADRLVVSNGEARLAGEIVVNVTDVGSRESAQSTALVVTSATGFGPDGPTLDVRPSYVGRYSLVQRSERELELGYDIDFAHAEARRSLNDNQEAVAVAMGGLHATGAVADDLLYLLSAEDAGSYGRALDALSPEPYAVSQWATVLSAQQFNNALMSCRERATDHRFIAEGQCVRIGVQGRRFERDSSSRHTGYKLDTAEISVGAQKQLGERWHLGFGLAYESWSADEDDRIWRSNADQFQAGVVAKHQIGATLLAASLNGGFADVDVTRRAGPGLVADGDQDVRFAGGQLRAAHAFERGRWYVKPRTDLSLTWVDTGGVDESGAGAASLDVDGEDELYVALQPAIEVGVEFAAAEGFLVRPRLGVGLTHFLDDPSPNATAAFRDAAGDSFKVTSEVDRTTLDLELGLDVLSEGGITLGLGAFAQLGEDTTHGGVAVRLTVPF